MAGALWSSLKVRTGCRLRGRGARLMSLGGADAPHAQRGSAASMTHPMCRSCAASRGGVHMGTHLGVVCMRVFVRVWARVRAHMSYTCTCTYTCTQGARQRRTPGPCFGHASLRHALLRVPGPPAALPAPP